VTAAVSGREREAGEKPLKRLGRAALIRATRLKPRANQTGIREKSHAVPEAVYRWFEEFCHPGPLGALCPVRSGYIVRSNGI
jgi:hypothetical protein